MKSTSSFEFMMGYLSMAAVCLIYQFLQKTYPKQIAEGEPGYEDDHGYAQPIEDDEVDGLFSTWWDKATLPVVDGDESGKKTVKDEEDPTGSPENSDEPIKAVDEDVGEA